jgi:hypothetical protein
MKNLKPDDFVKEHESLSDHLFGLYQCERIRMLAITKLKGMLFKKLGVRITIICDQTNISD